MENGPFEDGSVRLTQLRGQGVEAERHDISGLFPEIRVLVTTRGERFGDQPRCDDRRVLTLDCRCFSDPDGGLLRSHIETHLGVIDGIVRSSSKAVQELAETVMNCECERGNRRCWIDLWRYSIAMLVYHGVVLKIGIFPKGKVVFQTINFQGLQYLSFTGASLKGPY